MVVVVLKKHEVRDCSSAHWLGLLTSIADTCCENTTQSSKHKDFKIPRNLHSYCLGVSTEWLLKTTFKDPASILCSSINRHYRRHIWRMWCSVPSWKIELVIYFPFVAYLLPWASLPCFKQSRSAVYLCDLTEKITKLFLCAFPQTPHRLLTSNFFLLSHLFLNISGLFFCVFPLVPVLTNWAFEPTFTPAHYSSSRCYNVRLTSQRLMSVYSILNLPSPPLSLHKGCVTHS